VYGLRVNTQNRAVAKWQPERNLVLSGTSELYQSRSKRGKTHLALAEVACARHAADFAPS
jgi:hypothetical protein